MKRLTILLAAVALTSPLLLAQGRGQAQPSSADYQRMLDMGRMHRTAGDLYAVLKAAATGGKTTPPYRSDRGCQIPPK